MGRAGCGAGRQGAASGITARSALLCPGKLKAHLLAHEAERGGHAALAAAHDEHVVHVLPALGGAGRHPLPAGPGQHLQVVAHLQGGWGGAGRHGCGER